jgi:hypothetical protein
MTPSFAFKGKKLFDPLGLSLHKASTIAGQQIQAAVFWRMLL